jgi:SOS response regulatory protein OraA/RecX
MGERPAPPPAAAPVVTALRRDARGRVSVELDGRPWRTLPAEPVVAAGLDVGVALDRARARRLRAEWRRVEAREAALRAVGQPVPTEAAIRQRLVARGIAPADRERALETLERVGVVDDARVAQGRAAALAVRGGGDALIRDDLERRGVAPHLVDEAVGRLEPELERARTIVAARGASPRTLRRLAAKGFSEETIETLVADQPDAELG